MTVAPPARPSLEAARWPQDVHRSLHEAIRLTLLGLLVAAPLAFGAVHAPAYAILLVACLVCGTLSWVLGHWWRAYGEAVPAVPGRRLLAALLAVVAAQLLPLPPSVLRLLSPGSFAFYNDRLLVPLTAWRPISVSPPDTLRGLLFLAGLSLLYGAVFREFTETRWQERLALVVGLTGGVMTLEALLQAASPHPSRIYGLWQPRWDWAVFGPYVNRNHFAAYLVMALPLAVGLALLAAGQVGHLWRRRYRRWTALGEPAAMATIRYAALAMVLAVGLLASRSRGGTLGAVVAALALVAFLSRRWLAAAVVVLVGVLGASWVGVSGVLGGFQRGSAGRLDLWRDALSAYRHFPVFGAGFNAYGTLSPWYQTVLRSDWVGETHNEYLQVLVDTGLVGAGIVAALLVCLGRGLVRGRAGDALSAGLLASLAGLCAHNVVDFNWQIPANAVTFVALAGCALRRGLSTAREPLLDPPGGAA